MMTGFERALEWIVNPKFNNFLNRLMKTEGKLVLLSCSFWRTSRFCSFIYHRLIFCSSDDFQFRVFPVNDLVLDE